LQIPEPCEKRYQVIDYEFSEHAYEMMRERNIQKDWVKLAIEDPERKEQMDDGTVHYIKAIDQYEGRFLRVVVNPNVSP
jgi:hypothetical protein